ncbi:MAG: hypothetical protein Q4C70_15380, partial [Planctomycetia bacterium]|nr:hypothetical protein [Planctomycetia bacterium]
NFTDAVTESVTENFTDAVTGSVTESMNDYKESIMGNMDENIFNGNIQELTENMLSNVTENIGGYTGNVTEGATESIQEYAGSLSENVLGMAESLNLGNIHENIGNVIEDFTEKMPDISLPEGLNIPEEIGNGILGQIFTFCRKILTRS